MQIKYKGATPIEKNVIVVDEQGNKYEATYIKRAKGLVKNGRARFIGENKICLACPPNENLEDKTMSENKVTTAVESTTVTQNANDKAITLKYFLDQIEKIRKDNDHISDALYQLGEIKSEGPGDIGTEEKAKGIANVVTARETTNLRMIDFYEKAYNDLLYQEESQRNKKIDAVKDIWFSYLREACSHEDDISETKNYVQEQINLFVTKIMADKF